MSEFAIFLTSMILTGVFLVFCIAVDLCSIVRKSRVVKPVEFLPPEGFSPLDAALVYSARSVKANSFLNPLLLYWADQGYVSIEEDGRGLKVRALKDMPPFEESGRRDKSIYECERTLFLAMFRDSRYFYTLAARKSFDTEYDKAVEECRKMSRSVIGKLGKRLSLVMKLLAAALAFAVGIMISFYIQMPIAFILLFPVIGAFLIKFLPAPFFVRVPFMLVWGGVPLLAVLFMMPMPNTFRIALGAAVLTLVLTVCFFAEKTDFRSGEDLKIYGKVCSFRRFLTVADKNRLEALVEENPNYFYDILPYFYVFGITKKMKKKFDKIIPDGSMRSLGPIRDIYID